MLLVMIHMKCCHNCAVSCSYFFILIQKTSFFKADRVKEEVKPLITEQNSMPFSTYYVHIIL